MSENPVTWEKIESNSQNIRRYVVSWIVVVVMIVVIQLMVLFDVIHVVNSKSSEASDKSFLSTALEVFCLGECSNQTGNAGMARDTSLHFWNRRRSELQSQTDDFRLSRYWF